MQNNTFAYDTDAESYMPGDGLKYISDISDIESSGKRFIIQILLVTD